MHYLENIFNTEPKGSFFLGKEVRKMAETRDGDLHKNNEKPIKVIIIDNGEKFSKEKGSVPNHDKVEIIYISPKA